MLGCFINIYNLNKIQFTLFHLEMKVSMYNYITIRIIFKKIEI